jgi:hypothetical protein
VAIARRSTVKRCLALGRFAREARAAVMEFDNYGLARRHLQWNTGEAIPDMQATQPLPVPGGPG